MFISAQLTFLFLLEPTGRLFWSEPSRDEPVRFFLSIQLKIFRLFGALLHRLTLPPTWKSAILFMCALTPSPPSPPSLMFCTVKAILHKAISPATCNAKVTNKNIASYQEDVTLSQLLLTACNVPAIIIILKSSACKVRALISDLWLTCYTQQHVSQRCKK